MSSVWARTIVWIVILFTERRILGLNIYTLKNNVVLENFYLGFGFNYSILNKFI